MIPLINYGKLFYLMPRKDLLRLHESCALRSRYEMIRRHRGLDLLCKISLKSEVSVGDYTYKNVVIVNDRHTRDPVFAHELVRIL